MSEVVYVGVQNNKSSIYLMIFGVNVHILKKIYKSSVRYTGKCVTEIF